MKRILYILSLIVLAAACTHELDDQAGHKSEDGKVTVDFTVLVPDARPATKVMGETPQLSNLYLAVFDEVGYLAEYVKADPAEMATDDGVEYKYTVTLSLSPNPRIIHWIANAPESVQYGSEEEVLMNIKASGQEDMYWYRKEVESISGIEAGDLVQPTDETVAALSNIPLVRNFAKILLVDNASEFVLESYTVVNVLNSGFAAAYDFNKGEFVDYIKSDGSPKTYEELLAEGYNASTPAIANYISAIDAWNNKVEAGSACYVYERERPTQTPAFIIAYGSYKDNDPSYYKIDLRDEQGAYFPLFRNFQYTINLNAVSRNGYRTITEAANSGGSGDVSTSLETESLIYMSDGMASLEVGYTAIVVTTADPVLLPFAFYPNLKNLYDGPGGTVAQNFNASVEFVINDDAGISGAAIQSIGEVDYMFRPKPKVAINPTTPENNSKTQSITVIARYTDSNGIERSLQRKVKYTVMKKQLLIAECVPSEVPEEQGSAFDVNITIPGGLSVGMFPLNFNVEAKEMTMMADPVLDHMPVATGKSISGSGKSSFWFVKTLTWDEYEALENVGGKKTLTAHFKTNKDVSATDIYVSNEYFYGIVDGQEKPYAQTHLGNYTPQHFTNLKYNPNQIPAGREQATTFSFNMSAMPKDGEVIITIANAVPADTETKLTRLGVVDGNKVQYSYKPTAYTGTHSFALVTTTSDQDVSATLSAYHFVDASLSATRSRNSFNGSFVQGSLGVDVIENVEYKFTLPAHWNGMEVTVILNGLEPADGKLTGGSGNTYTYKPAAGGAQTLTLRTINLEEKECTITLKADGYNDETDKIDQRGVQTVTINNRTISGTLSGTVDYSNSNRTFSVTITTGDKSTTASGNISRNWQFSGYTYSYSFVIDNWTVEYEKPTQIVNVRLRYRNNSQNYYSGTCTVQDLIDGNITGLVLTRE